MTHIGLNLRVSGYSSQGGRKYMEDALVIAVQESEDGQDLEYAFFAVYDGHGGKEASLFAKKHLMENIVNLKYFWSEDDHLVLKAIRDGFLITHLAMWKELENWPKTVTGLPSTAGTTASIGFIRQQKLYIGHVGDSRIVLGYSTQDSESWHASSLTTDHKPDLPSEKKRIYNSGGLVIKKSGVDRVVWKRPRVGHQGPVRRSTDFDKIPFLAVARSLGDLWSYDFLHETFVVSPEPDVKVITLDSYKDRCLIIGSDGLWNVLTACDAVLSVQKTEQENDELASKLNISDPMDSLINSPAKVLVNYALEKWNKLKTRADNTSVIAIMLDELGPAKHPLHKNQELRAMLDIKGQIEDHRASIENTYSEDCHKTVPSDNSTFWCQSQLKSDYLRKSGSECKECANETRHKVSQRMTSSPLQIRQIYDNYPDTLYVKPMLPKTNLDEAENRPNPMPRWSKSASGQTSLSKLVTWSKFVNGRHLNDDRTMNSVSRTSNFVDKTPKTKIGSLHVTTSIAPTNVKFKEWELIEEALLKHRAVSVEAMKQLSAFKNTIKRKYPGTDVIHCQSEDNLKRDCTSPWKRKPITSKLNITALKAINEFKTLHNHRLKF